jgi:HD-GYP domain-containing protein (c-di-GMP phosphodiesterase class II)
MTTNRSYRPALSFAEALVELRRCSGSQFDPQVIVAIDNLMTNSAQPLPEASERRLADALTALTMYLHRGSRQHRLLSRRTALGHELGRRA